VRLVVVPDAVGATPRFNTDRERILVPGGGCGM
jgi:hypothetical protein